MRDLTVSVLIPAYNEVEGIAGVIDDVSRSLEGQVAEYEIIVVDDGSKDGTADAVDPKKARLIRHPRNGGYGKALYTGIEAARHDWLLMIDGDGSYPASQIPALLPFAPRFDLIIGARSGALFWGSPSRALLRWIYLRLASFTVGEPVPDANSGLRLVRRGLLDDAALVQCLGYSFSTTMTLSFLKAGRFVAYVPIEFRERKGRSKVKYARDILRTLQLMTEVMIIYNPLKLFVAQAAALAALAAVSLAAYGATGGPLWLAAAALCGFSSLCAFWVGCVLDSMRMHGRAGASGRVQAA